MRASKENAVKMMTIVRKNMQAFDETVSLLRFLDACRRKLPSEAAYERERKRRRTQKK